MEDILAAQKNKVDAVVASNDGTALGALQAMEVQGLAGKVPISGQDASAAGSESIVEGGLTVTVFKDIRKLSPLAIQLALDLVNGVKTGPVADLKMFNLADLALNEQAHRRGALLLPQGRPGGQEQPVRGGDQVGLPEVRRRLQGHPREASGPRRIEEDPRRPADAGVRAGARGSAAYRARPGQHVGLQHDDSPDDEGHGEAVAHG